MRSIEIEIADGDSGVVSADAWIHGFANIHEHFPHDAGRRLIECWQLCAVSADIDADKQAHEWDLESEPAQQKLQRIGRVPSSITNNASLISQAGSESTFLTILDLAGPVLCPAMDSYPMRRVSTMILRRFILALLVLSQWNIVTSGQSNRSPRVTTGSGIVEGSVITSTNQVSMFFGISYAAPPVGNLRWRPPQPAPTWTGVRKANTFGAGCPQSKAAVVRYSAAAHEYAEFFTAYEGLHFSEDCLYLNILTPNVVSKTKLPVMFWIHGGGNVEGTGALPPFAPSLAQKGVVLVSINYRLGALGFLAHPGLTAESAHHASGNYGILDQIAALQWVRRNIAEFGGDPGNITIFGSSAGGVFTCYLMVSPLAQGLFQKVIAQSGGCRDYLLSEVQRFTRYEQGSGTAEGLGVRFAEAVGIADGPEALVKLRAKTPDEIQQALEGNRSLNFNSDPTIDGWVLMEQPAITFSEGRQAKIPVLVGSNADEYTTLLDDEHDPKTVEQHKSWIKNQFWDNPERILDVYPVANDKEVRPAFLALATDYNFGNGAHLVAQDTVRAGQKSYLYFFSYRAKGPSAPFGAHHDNEIKFLSGMFRKSMWGPPDAEDLQFAETVSGYWVQFAKTGNPNRSGLPNWPAYELKSDQCLELGHEIKPRVTPHTDKYALFEQSLKSRLASATLPPQEANRP